MTLLLDDRRRAMLAEMGVRVFGPADRSADSPIAETASAIRRDKPASVAVTPAVAAIDPLSLVSPAPAAPAPVLAPAPIRLLGDRPAGIAALDWPSLQAAVAGCTACKLCERRTNTVFGVGQPPAAEGQAPRVDWMVVGEAPGENEDLQGEPFVGQAGKLLDNMLRSMGLARHDNVFIANVLKCRPPGNRNPAPEEVAQCEPFLRRQVALLQPKVILAMGRFAVQSLLGSSEPIGRLRGRVHAYEGVPVVVTYHPAYLLRSLPDKAKAWSDLCLAMATKASTPP